MSSENSEVPKYPAYPGNDKDRLDIIFQSLVDLPVTQSLTHGELFEIHLHWNIDVPEMQRLVTLIEETGLIERVEFIGQSSLKISAEGRKEIKKFNLYSDYLEAIHAESESINKIEALKNENIHLQNKVLKFEVSTAQLTKDLKDALYVNATADQIAKAKKRKWGALGTIIGSTGSLILEHLKSILEWLLKIFHG